MRSTLLLFLFLGIIILRLIALILGCFYGPYIYIVVPLGGLYLTLDCLAAYAIHASDGGDVEGDSNERILCVAWALLNALAVVGLLVAVVLFLDLGFWAMTHTPIHLAQFIIILCLIIFLVAGIALVVMNLNKSGRRGGSKSEYKGLAY